jgi:hypothetical protein
MLAFLFLVAALLVVPTFASFGPELRRIGAAVTATIRGLADGLHEMLFGALRYVWLALAPSTPIAPLGTAVGLGILGVVAGVAYANFTVTRVTLDVLLPTSEGARAVAFAVVAFTSVIGALWHLHPRSRIATGPAGIALLVVVGILAWLRTRAVSEGVDVDLPAAVTELDAMLPRLAVILTVFLSVAEMIAVEAVVALAGPSLPVLFAAPVLVAMAVAVGIVRLLRLVAIEHVVDVVIDAIANACRHVTDLLRRALLWLMPEAFRYRRHVRLMAWVQREFDANVHADSLMDTRAATEHARSRVALRRDVETVHERVLLDAIRRMEARYVERVIATLDDHGDQVLEEVMASISASIRAKAMAAASSASATEAAARVSSAALSIFRPLGLFSRMEGKEPNNQIIN